VVCLLLGISVSLTEWITASIFTREAAAGNKWLKDFFWMHPWVCTRSPQGLSATKSHHDHGRFRLAAQSLKLKIHFQWAPMTTMVLTTLIAYFVAVWFLKTNTGNRGPSSLCLYIAVIIAKRWATFSNRSHSWHFPHWGENFFYRSLLCVFPTRSFFVVELHVTLNHVENIRSDVCIKTGIIFKVRAWGSPIGLNRPCSD
jgi:hypothetical protein